MFAGLRFVVAAAGLDDEDVTLIQSQIVQHGGELLGQEYTPQCTHVLVVTNKAPEVERAHADGRCVVTDYWLEACVKKGELQPTSIPGFEKLLICLTGYTEERDSLYEMIWAAGGRHTGRLTKAASHLIAKHFMGAKWEFASAQQHIAVVNHAWLNDCLGDWEYKPATGMYVTMSGAQFEEGGGGLSQRFQPPPPTTTTAATSASSPAAATVAAAAAATAAAAVSTSPDWVQLKDLGGGPALVSSKRNHLDAGWANGSGSDGSGSGIASGEFTGICATSPGELERALGVGPLPCDRYHTVASQGSPNGTRLALPNSDAEFWAALSTAVTAATDGVARCAAVAEGRRRFELLQRQLPPGATPPGVRSHPMSGGGTDGGPRVLVTATTAEAADVAAWKKLASALGRAESRKSKHEVLIARRALEEAKGSSVGEMLLETFCTAYLPFAWEVDGFSADVLSSTGSLLPASARVPLPARAIRNLPKGTMQAPSHRTLGELAVDFHELLTGPSLPMPTPLQAANGAVSACLSDRPTPHTATVARTPASCTKDGARGRSGSDGVSPIAPFPTLSPAEQRAQRAEQAEEERRNTSSADVALCDAETMLEVLEEEEARADAVDGNERPAEMDEDEIYDAPTQMLADPQSVERPQQRRSLQLEAEVDAAGAMAVEVSHLRTVISSTPDPSVTAPLSGRVQTARADVVCMMPPPPLRTRASEAISEMTDVVPTSVTAADDEELSEAEEEKVEQQEEEAVDADEEDLLMTTGLRRSGSRRKNSLLVASQPSQNEEEQTTSAVRSMPPPASDHLTVETAHTTTTAASRRQSASRGRLQLRRASASSGASPTTHGGQEARASEDRDSNWVYDAPTQALDAGDGAVYELATQHAGGTQAHAEDLARMAERMVEERAAATAEAEEEEQAEAEDDAMNADGVDEGARTLVTVQAAAAAGKPARGGRGRQPKKAAAAAKDDAARATEGATEVASGSSGQQRARRGGARPVVAPKNKNDAEAQLAAAIAASLAECEAAPVAAAASSPPKRGRGRPRKVAEAATEEMQVEEREIAEDDEEETEEEAVRTGKRSRHTVPQVLADVTNSIVGSGSSSGKGQRAEKQAQSRAEGGSRARHAVRAAASGEERWVALSGMHKHERRVALAAVRALGGKVTHGHEWDARTQLVLFGSVSGRGEKYLAGAAAGCELLDAERYLAACTAAGGWVAADGFEWDGGRGTGAGMLEPEVSLRWRKWHAANNHDATAAASGRKAIFAGLKVVLYGDFDAKNALRRVIAAGGGQVAASAPPFTAAIELGLACAVVDPTKGKTNRWVRELTAAGVPCVHPDLFVDWLARPSVDPTQHLLHGVSLGPRLTAALARSLSVHTGGAGAAGTAVAAR